MEEDEDSEEMFAMMDRLQWTEQGVSEPVITPSLSQMFVLVKRMGYKMRPIARRANRRDFLEHCSPPDRDIAHLFGRDFTRSAVFQLRSDGTYTSSLPKAGFDSIVQATRLEHAVR